MLHYYLSENSGSFLYHGFVFSCNELVQILLDLRTDFPRHSQALEDLSAILYDDEVLKNSGDCIKNETLILELL